MKRVGPVERVATQPEQAIVETRPTPIVSFDPQTHGPIAAKLGSNVGVRIEAPWSARAKELAAIALEASEHRSEREAIAIAMTSILSAPELAGAKIGLGVESDAGLLFAHELDRSLNPASNAKLCTAMFALGVLGPNHRFVTEVKKNGRDVHLIGGFDPSLDSAALEALAKKIGPIEGELVLDVSRLRGSRDPAGFDRYGDQDWQYLARPEALSVNRNLLSFTVLPGNGDAIVKTDQRAFAVRSTVKTIEPRAKFKVGIDEVDGQPIIELTGTIAADYAKGKELVMKSPDPIASFADELRRAFERAGISIGGIRIGETPATAQTIHAHRSRPLRELLEESIATSNAFDHEMYALAAAAQGGSTSLAEAREAMERWLKGIGLADPEMANASGIGNLDRLSAGDLLKLLSIASGDRRYASLLSALARPGQTGTLMTRMLGTAAEGLLRAKTGTGDDAVALSGTIGSGKRAYRFSAIIDDGGSREGARAVLDAIGMVLAEINSRRSRSSRSQRT